MLQLENCWKVFLQPPKQTYTQYDLGPTHFQSGKYTVTRHEFGVRNKANSLLRGSFFEVPGKSICVLYMHSFNGCKIEAINLARLVTSQGFSFCCFDFQASGLSEGRYVTFGAHEQFDVLAIKQYIEQNYYVDGFVLWGRSMGATTSLLFSINQGNSANNILSMILDSPFHDLNKLTIKMVQRQYKLPKLIIKGLLSVVKRKIEDTASFKFDEVKLPSPINLDIPCLFLASKQDNVIPFKFVEKVMNVYKGPKHLIELKQGHNENRDPELMDQCIMWIQNQLRNKSQQRSPIRSSGDGQKNNTSLRVPEGVKIKERITKQSMYQKQQSDFQNYSYPPPHPHQQPQQLYGLDVMRQRYGYLVEHKPHNRAQQLKMNMQRELSPDLRVVNRILL